MPLSQNIDWNSGVLGLLSLTLQVATLNLKGIFAKDLVLNFYMELTGDLFHRHSIFHCQLNDLLYLLLFRLTRLAGRLWSQDLLLLSLQRFDAFPGCGDLRIILCHNRLFFDSSSLMDWSIFAIFSSTSAALSCGVRRVRLFSDSSILRSPFLCV